MATLSWLGLGAVKASVRDKPNFPLNTVVSLDILIFPHLKDPIHLCIPVNLGVSSNEETETADGFAESIEFFWMAKNVAVFQVIVKRDEEVCCKHCCPSLTEIFIFIERWRCVL